MGCEDGDFDVFLFLLALGEFFEEGRGAWAELEGHVVGCWDADDAFDGVESEEEGCHFCCVVCCFYFLSFFL